MEAKVIAETRFLAASPYIAVSNHAILLRQPQTAVMRSAQALPLLARSEI
ncbi:MAG: hypothetical protein F6J93_07960 [Oscillatoria sp. SIO1A7]|nr:hypothetical protein [Oscillatoria sp. SIO1A7]